MDFCRAVAAAVLGDANKVEFVPLIASTRFPALQSRRIDLLLSNTTWTLTREVVLKVQFRDPFLRRPKGSWSRTVGIKSIADLKDATICVTRDDAPAQPGDLFRGERLAHEAAGDQLGSRGRGSLLRRPLSHTRRMPRNSPACGCMHRRIDRLS